ncbi:hypothetical protein DPMN_177858 [Dreissena polymorpha]|uniref:Uncharacterized protein n=1 Tax=Dreissena polymorpha TaxID=45954 RepID=A0A9D4IM18_DREPO|nr:hypothetical protein DPMN_177858 [Dreissena polymorpha]
MVRSIWVPLVDESDAQCNIFGNTRCCLSDFPIHHIRDKTRTGFNKHNRNPSRSPPFTSGLLHVQYDGGIP